MSSVVICKGEAVTGVQKARDIKVGTYFCGCLGTQRECTYLKGFMVAVRLSDGATWSCSTADVTDYREYDAEITLRPKSAA